MLAKIVSDFQVRFYGIDQCRLGMLLLGEGFHDAVINGTLCDDVLHHYGFGGLTLPPETGYSLLIQFQTPSQPEPHQRGAAGLKVESMSCRCRVDQRHRDFTVIPSADAGGVIQTGERNAFSYLNTKQDNNAV